MSTLRLNKLSFFDSSDSSVAIDTGSILTGTAAQFKITGGTANQALVTDGSGNLSFTDVTSDPTMGGDLSGLASNAQIVADAVGTAEIAADAVTANEIAAGAVGSSEIATDAVTANEIATDAVGSSEIAADAVGSSEIATGAVGATEIASTIDLSSKTVTLPAASVTAHIPPLPTVTSLTYPGGITNLNPAGGETLIITGTNFVSGMEVQIGLIAAPTITVDSATQITITTPALPSATYTLVVIHPGGHRGSISVSYSTTPAWTTATGSLGSMTELTAGSFTVLATSDSTITYSQQSGTLPSGITLAPSTGIISGTGTSDLAADTAYNFTLRATDLESQTSDRAFGITVNAVPSITSLDYPGDDTALDPAGAQILIITGASFEVGVTTTIDSTSVAVTRDSATQLTIPSTPAKAASTYTNGLVATNPSGLSATANIIYSNLPVFSVAAGALGSFDAETAISVTLDATGDAPLTYALTSGALPTGITLNTTTGIVSGTTPVVTEDTTYNFTIEVTDAQNQSVSRAYSFIILSFQVGNSARFNEESNTYFERVFPGEGDKKCWTMSCWVKGAFAADNTGNPGEYRMFSGSNGGGGSVPRSIIEFGQSGRIWYGENPSGSTWTTDVRTEQYMRDPAAWYHVVVVRNTNNPNDGSNRVKIYINGERVTQMSSSVWPPQNDQGITNNNVLHRVGAYANSPDGSDGGFDGCMTEFHFIDGAEKKPTDFAEIKNNQYVPKKYEGTFGGNGFYLKFDQTDFEINTDQGGGATGGFAQIRDYSGTAVDMDRSDRSSGPDKIDVTTSITWEDNLSAYVWPAGTPNCLVNGNIAYSHEGGGWFTNGASAAGNYLRFDMGTPKTYTTAEWVYRTSSGTEGQWKWQGSNDETTWTDIGSAFELSPIQQTATNTLNFASELGSNTTAYRWYQILGISGSVNGGGRRMGMHFGPGEGRAITMNGDVQLERPLTATDNPRQIKDNMHVASPVIGSSAIKFGMPEGNAVGAGDQLEVDTHADWNMGTEDFTLEAWVYHANMAQNYEGIICHRNSSGYELKINVNHNIQFWNSDTAVTVGSDKPISNNIWYHVAITRKADVIKMWIDGKLQTARDEVTSLTDTTHELLIGQENQRNNDNRWNGYMDEIRISKGIARYTIDFTPSTTEFTPDSYTKLLIHSNNNTGTNITDFTDSSASAHTVNGDDPQHGSPPMHFAPKFGKGSLVFDNTDTNEYIPLDNLDSTVGHDFWQMGSEDWTAECWMWLAESPSSDSGKDLTFYAQNHDNHSGHYTRYKNTGVNYQWHWKMYLQNDTNILNLEVTDNGVSTEEWFHIAFVKQGMTCTIYRNGVPLGSGTLSQNPEPLNRYMEIGRWSSSATNNSYFDGMMEEVRFSNIARYTADFSSSLQTEPFKDDVHTRLLMHFDQEPITNVSTNAIFYTGGKPSKAAPSYIKFDGSGDNLQIPYSTDFNFGTGDITLEFWMATPTVPNSGQSAPSNHVGVIGYCEYTGGRWHGWGIGLREKTSGVLTMMPMGMFSDKTGAWAGPDDELEIPLNNSWHHYAFVRQGTSAKIYKDGVLGSSWTCDGGAIDATDLSTSNTLRIGRFDFDDIYFGEFEGNLDQIRLSNSARYTANFTPSTTPFTNDANTKLLIQGDFKGGLGQDSAILGADFIPVNIKPHDRLPDTPLNNFATMNPATHPRGGNSYFNDSNLRVWNDNWDGISGTIAVSSGKWYWEVRVFGTASTKIGVWDTTCVSSPNSLNSHDRKGTICYYENGQKMIDNAASAYGSSFTKGDIIGVALDLSSGIENGTVTFYKIDTQAGTSVSQGVIAFSAYNIAKASMVCPFTSLASQWVTYNFGQDGAFGSYGAMNQGVWFVASNNNQDENDIGDFFGPVPAGYLAMCTKNLPTPTIADPGEHFNVKAWIGNGGDRAFTEVGFQPDLVWGKSRSNTYPHNWYDSVRGATKLLTKNTVNPETSGDANGSMVSLDSDGFTTENGGATNYYWNKSGDKYVAWNWKAGGANPTQTYVVTVAGSQDYYFDGNATATPTIDLQEGGTYTFDESDSSNATHLIAFSTTADGTFGGGTEYTTGVTHIGTPGQAGAKTTITVAAGAPQLHYYCVYHGAMGGVVNTTILGGYSNFQGTIPSIVSANQTSGFSIIGWIGNQTGSSTVGHGLSKAPEFIITKCRTASNQDWPTYHMGAGGTAANPLTPGINGYINWNSNSQWTSNGSFYDALPTNTVFSPGGHSYVNSNTDPMISYCFHPVPGFSKIGVYRGNGTGHGPFVHTGFLPAMIIIMQYDGTDNWTIWDTARDLYNGGSNSNWTLEGDTTSAEWSDSNFYHDKLSNGFKLRSSHVQTNQNNTDYLYLAFAQSPFKTSNAR